jgi:hypothetical protein
MLLGGGLRRDGGAVVISDEGVRGSCRGLRRLEGGVFTRAFPPLTPARRKSHMSLGQVCPRLDEHMLTR